MTVVTSDILMDKELLHKKELANSQAALLNVLDDQKKDSEKILKKKAVDEAILASIGDGLVVVDKEGKITYVNQSFEKMLGWSSKEVLGKRIVAVVPREDEKGEEVPFNERILNKVLRGEVVVTDLTNPFYYIRKDKTRFPSSSIVTSIVLDGEIIGVVETFRDITKEKEIDKAKTEFVSLASHQLRTPLSTINWYTEMLLTGDVGKLNAEQEKYLNEVYRGNQRMVGLVNALLSVSRMDLGTFIFEPEPTDIPLLVRSVLDEQMPHIIQKGITVFPTFGTNIPLIQVDPKLLRMVVQNLLSNAIKYTPEKGKIDLSLTLTDEKKCLLFTISDTGYGIPKNQQHKIFQKLFRADNVREKDTEGTGLGLYIAKAIIDNSGGKIWFESPVSNYIEGEENVGTTFYVELPCKLLEKSK
ncbi:MAG: PAS domain S-box protein [Candidatus Pacebacteria bacterium]|nr:PAS domain S-box protein [Candidatus Paceibacterota bacterium]MBP9832063.1 PAS domain S-box protein [Candidatus Paceibacterota bacterium]